MGTGVGAALVEADAADKAIHGRPELDPDFDRGSVRVGDDRRRRVGGPDRGGLGTGLRSSRRGGEGPAKVDGQGIAGQILDPWVRRSAPQSRRVRR